MVAGGKPSGTDARSESSEASYVSVLALGAFQFYFLGGYFLLTGGARGDVGQDVGVRSGPRFPGPTIPLWRRGFHAQ